MTRRLIAPRRLTWGTVAGVMAALLAPSLAHAHFFWLEAGRDGKLPTASGFLSETPEPDRDEFLKYVAKAQISADGKPLTWSVVDNVYKVALPDPAPSVVDGTCDMGLKTRGDATYRLLYTARAQFGMASLGQKEEGDSLRVRLVDRPGKAPVLRVCFQGKPARDVEVNAFPKKGDPISLKTDDQGMVEVAGLSDGTTGILARLVDRTPGEFEGKPYPEVHHFATLTTAPPAPPLAILPEAINSFGGAVLGDFLYVYGGHTAGVHTYFAAATTGHFRRLNLRNRIWEDLPDGPPLQGVALVPHDGKLYRVGGMVARNAEGEPDDLVSVADFARFDPPTRTWSNLPPMPAPRSTHDAAVLGTTLYVVGGWNMPGGSAAEADFVTDALSFDLSRPDARWEPIPAPETPRRALAVAAFGGKLYALGGLTDGMKVRKGVDLFDPATKTWSRGPDLPGPTLQGFAPSAFAVGDHLYLSGRDGVLYRLGSSGEKWHSVGRLETSRITHRLLPGIAGDVLIVGGNGTGSPIRSIESIPIPR